MSDGADWSGQACLDAHRENDHEILPSSVLSLFPHLSVDKELTDGTST